MRQPRFGSDGIHRKAKRLALLAEQPDDRRTDGFNFGPSHTVGIPEKAFDKVCAYRHKWSVSIFLRRLGPDPHADGTRTESLRGCPDVFELVDGDFAIIGKDMTEFAEQLPPSASCGPDERMVRVPRRILVGAKRDIPETV